VIWKELMDLYEQADEPYIVDYGANLMYRDTVVGSGENRRFIFALPAMNNSRAPTRTRALRDFAQRLVELKVRR
jgi:hypothetical protein